jgi:predicted Fe-Mo cluster-binding NifX family protein
MMKIAVSSTGPVLEAEIDEKFGRCKYFVIVDLDTLAFEAVPNTAAFVSAGAGVPAAMLMVNRGVETVLTGEVGPSATEVLVAAGIPVYTGIQGTLLEAVEMFKDGRLRHTVAPTVDAGFGLRER